MPTRASAEQALLSRVNPFLVTLGAALAQPGAAPVVIIDVSGASPIASFSDPISLALAACGVLPVDPSLPVDSDMAKLQSIDWWKFLDIAELRLLETVASASSGRAGSQRWEDYSVTRSTTGLTAALNDKRAQVRRQWGWGSPTLGQGSIDPGIDRLPYFPLW
jgi:hypothetical protein